VEYTRVPAVATNRDPIWRWNALPALLTPAPSRLKMVRFNIRTGPWTVIAFFVLGACLFGDCHTLRTCRVLGSVFGEVTAVLNEAGTQWMVFVCAAIYFVAFVVLRCRVAGGRRAGTRWGTWLPGEFWLLGLVVVAVLAYAFDYTQAVKSKMAVTLLGGAMVGQGVSFFESRKQKAESRNGGGGILLVLVVLLAAAAGWQAETRLTFQYRGQTRWSGPWDNPNTFGMLMGVGVVLSLGRLCLGKVEKLKTEMLKAEGEHPTSNIESPTSNWWVWVRRVFLLVAAGVMGWGLLKSYSRGAWVGTLMGAAYLLWNAEGRRMKDEGNGGNAEGKRKNAESRCSRGSRVSWALLILVSLCVLGFWSFRDTERLVARRAFSVGNVNDFSWRNRVAAYEGALQMMAEKPWLGFGWNQAERVYEQFYRKPQVAEGAAIQLNDYFTLGTTLGVPALLCFLIYVGLSVTRPLTTDYRSLTTDYGPPTADCWFKTICRAGAIVFLVGFWFDGGLFKLATAAPFWILLELGRVRNYEIHEAQEND
jgi:O-antigen ligase